jgi:hypothetical protein
MNVVMLTRCEFKGKSVRFEHIAEETIANFIDQFGNMWEAASLLVWKKCILPYKIGGQ